MKKDDILIGELTLENMNFNTKEGRLEARDWFLAEHEEMWNWIADQIEFFQIDFENSNCSISRLKRLYMELIGFENGEIRTDCFLCEYSDKIITSEGLILSRCEYCPLVDYDKWGGCLNGLYSNEETKNSEWARKIANLPIINNKGVK